MQIFGSDGFRCEFGVNFMTPKFIYEFANSLGDFCINHELDSPVLIARDTRASGVILEDLISAILLFKGIEVVLCGVLPTPGLSTVLASGKYSMGIMITASHNPYHDNGIKLFDGNGFKLHQSKEAEIENGILNPKEMKFQGQYGFQGKSSVDGTAIYADYVLNQFSTIKLDESILVDCSNGACSDVAQDILKNFKNVDFVNINPNGRNINLDCGALESEKLLALVRAGDYAYGVAFDGDGDRSIFVNADYGVIESEKMLCLFYQLLKLLHKSNVVVTTEICNLGLAHNLQLLGADLIETEVGDRFVTEEVRDKNAVFGGEPSGHYYFPTMSKSMDGLLGLMHFLQVLHVSGKELPHQLANLKHYDRVVKNISIENVDLTDLEYIKQKLILKINPSEEKLVIRQSMWDPVIRVYYDYVHTNRFNIIEKAIYELLPH